MTFNRRKNPKASRQRASKLAAARGHASDAEPDDQRDASALDRDSKRNARRSSQTSELSLEAQLDRKALSYLNRYDASVLQLRRVLQRFARKADADGEAGSADKIEALLVRFQGSGLLDDARFARSMAYGLRQRGLSRRAVMAKLRSRGIGDADAQTALEATDADASAGSSDDANAELMAARRFAKKKRLGPHRPESERQAKLRRDMAALARAGFSYDIVRTVIRTDELEDDTF